MSTEPSGAGEPSGTDGPAPVDTGRPSRRLQQARERYATAVAEEDRLRQTATPARQRRGRRVAAGIRLAVVAAVIAAIGLAGVGWWAQRSADSATSASVDAEAARGAAEHAIVVMLTADPAHADRYVDDVLAVSTGDQRVRIQGARAALQELVAQQPRPTSGQILSSGVVGTDTDATGRQKTSVLLVAQTSSPELVGGDPSQNRVGLSVSMMRDGDRWMVQHTEAVS